MRRGPRAEGRGPSGWWVLAALVAGCGDYREGVSIVLSAEVQPVDEALLLPTGGTLTLHAASLHVRSVSVTGCTDGDRAETGPTLVTLLSSEAQPLGRIHPRAGRYCALAISFAPAGHDSAALPPGGHDAVVGTTLRLAGTVETGASFALKGSGVATATLPIDLVLDEEHREAELSLRLDARRLFTPAALEGPADAQTFLDRADEVLSLAP